MPISPDLLEEELLRFLLTEHRASRRAMLLLHELTVEERVGKGVSLTDLKALDSKNGKLRFHFPLQPCKLREGDWMVLGQGRPVGPEVSKGLQVVVASLDPLSRTVELDPIGQYWELPDSMGGCWTLDYLSSDMNVFKLMNAVRSSLAEGDAFQSLLAGNGWAGSGLSAPPPGGLDESQTIAAREAISGGLTLIHGPPGTGKTRVLAAIIESLVGFGKNVLVSAFTHRAIDNVLHAVKILNPGIDVVKLGRRSPDIYPGISTVSPQRLPRIKFAVVGATVYAAMKLSPRLQFDAVVIDEAGQLPMAHSLIPLARTRGSLVLAGDHFQLHPVLTGSHGESFAASSIFAHLAALYPERLFMLRTSYRLPPGLCSFPSKTFYGGALKSHSRTDPDLPSCPPNPRHPEIAALWHLQGSKRAAWVNHAGYGALISSRLMPPNVGAINSHVLINSSGSSVSTSMSKTSISANFLNRAPLPSMTGFPATAPIFPSPSTAVPFDMTATRLPFAVYS